MLRKTALGFRRLLQSAVLLMVLGVVGLLFMLQPMSVNFLQYLLWKTTSSAPSQRGYILNNGAYIHYDAYGSGFPVLLLHGGLSDKLSWFSQIPWLVGSGRQVVTIDTRGHGQSSHGETALDYQLFADDAIKVLDKLGIKRTDIVGWSDGGITALLLGLESPERVGRIVAISANFHPSGLVNEPYPLENQAYEDLRNELFYRIRGFWAAPNANHADLEKELLNLWHTQPQLQHDDLRSITAPTLIVAGENDLIELAHSGELAQKLAAGKIEIVLGAGHAAPVTHAREINDLIGGFLGVAAE